MRKPSDPVETLRETSSPIAELLADPVVAIAARPLPPVLGLCVATEHPTRSGCVEIEWMGDEGRARGWALCLLGVGVRVGDRVLLGSARGCSEPIVMGVLDGFAERPAASSRAAASAKLGAGEHLSIEDSRGREVVRVTDGEHGPVVRLLSGDVALELDGRLQIRAHEIKLEATLGAVEIEATHDIRLDGEVIHLN